jgi:hypothetical protein
MSVYGLANAFINELLIKEWNGSVLHSRFLGILIAPGWARPSKVINDIWLR